MGNCIVENNNFVLLYNNDYIRSSKILFDTLNSFTEFGIASLLITKVEKNSCCLLDNNGNFATLKKLSQEFDYNYEVLRRHFKKFTEIGLLTKTKVGNKNQYFINPFFIINCNKILKSTVLLFENSILTNKLCSFKHPLSQNYINFGNKEILYILKSLDDIKVGYSSNFLKRLDQYKSYNKNIEILFVYELNSAKELEQMIHNLFKEKSSYRKEWYNIKYLDDIIKFIENYKLTNRTSE